MDPGLADRIRRPYRSSARVSFARVTCPAGHVINLDRQETPREGPMIAIECDESTCVCTSDREVVGSCPTAASTGSEPR